MQGTVHRRSRCHKPPAGQSPPCQRSGWCSLASGNKVCKYHCHRNQVLDVVFPVELPHKRHLLLKVAVESTAIGYNFVLSQSRLLIQTLRSGATNIKLQRINNWTMCLVCVLCAKPTHHIHMQFGRLSASPHIQTKQNVSYTRFLTHMLCQRMSNTQQMN